MRIQIMLFANRLEIWNPGVLPYGLTIAKLHEPHPSIPSNPLIAESLYLAGQIERMGTGTGEIISRCEEIGLLTPVFVQEENFKVIIYRSNDEPVNEPVNERNEMIIELILQNKFISKIQIAEKCGVSLITIKRDIGKFYKIIYYASFNYYMFL